jgi:hypothetical protein
VWTSLKIWFLNKFGDFSNFQKPNLNLNKFLYFQSCNYKIFIKIYHVSRFLLFVYDTQAKHVDMWFFCIESPFPLLNVHQIVSIFL